MEDKKGYKTIIRYKAGLKVVRVNRRRCDCCGRSIRELKLFGGPGDALVGDFTGPFLMACPTLSKIYRG